MTPFRSPDLTVILIRGSDVREVPLVALAAAAHFPCELLRRACMFLLDADRVPAATSPETLPREGDTGGESALHCPKDIKKRALHVGEEIGGMGEREGESTALTATELVSALSSPQSQLFFEQLVATHEPRHVHRALKRALAVSADHLRTTRAAYFVGVLRQIARQKSGSLSIISPPDHYA